MCTTISRPHISQFCDNRNSVRHNCPYLLESLDLFIRYIVYVRGNISLIYVKYSAFYISLMHTLEINVWQAILSAYTANLVQNHLLFCKKI